ncbi:MAG: hypothetical protein LM523_07085 [Candidatus Contendobacter sp.]|nr:hypothetical protein [Candidatus Contendobacter sp.]
MDLQTYFSDIRTIIAGELAAAAESVEAARALAPIAAVLDRLRVGVWAALEQIRAVLARGLALVARQDPALAELRLELLTLER